MTNQELQDHLESNLTDLSNFINGFSLKEEVPIKNIKLETIQEKTFEGICKDLKFEKSHYSEKALIYKVSFQGVEAKELLTRFRKAKKRTEKGSRYPLNRKLCRDNHLENNTNCLYVGSKKKGFHLRFKQHLGFGPKGTYALNLKYWLPKEAIIQFDVYSIEGLPKDDEKRQFFMEFVEQGIWELNKPLLGKKSGL